jgi:hypothetical protein
MSFIGMFAAIYHPVGMAMLIDLSKARPRTLAFNGVCGNLGVTLTAFLMLAGVYVMAAAVIGAETALRTMQGAGPAGGVAPGTGSASGPSVRGQRGGRTAFRNADWQARQELAELGWVSARSSNTNVGTRERERVPGRFPQQ